MSSQKNTTSPHTDIIKDLSLYHYNPPTIRDKKSPMVNVQKNVNNKDRPRYQLVGHNEDRMIVPFGISEPPEQYRTAGSEKRKNFDISLDSPALVEAFNALDEQNIEVAFKNSPVWFKKSLSRENIEFMYNKIVRQDEEGKYAPRIRTKVNVKGYGDRNTRFFKIKEEDGCVTYEQADYTIVKPMSRVIPIIEVGSLWFNSKAFGMSLECTDVIVFPTVEREAFPFQWGDDTKVVATENSHFNSAQEESAANPTEAGAGVTNMESVTESVDNFNPPSEPFNTEPSHST